MDNKTVINIIYALMDYYEINQEQLADKLKTSASNISKWLNKKQSPNRQQQLKIVNLYNKTFSEEIKIVDLKVAQDNKTTGYISENQLTIENFL